MAFSHARGSTKEASIVEELLEKLVIAEPKMREAPFSSLSLVNNYLFV